MDGWARGGRVAQGKVTGVFSQAFQRPQHMLVSAVPIPRIPCMIKAAVYVVSSRKTARVLAAANEDMGKGRGPGETWPRGK